jgi:hypothetical protein
MAMNPIVWKRIRTRVAAVALATMGGMLLLSTPGAGHAQTEVRDADNPARQPFQAALGRQLLTSFGDLNTFEIANVPLGKRLVIEHVSFRLAGGSSSPGEESPFAQAVALLETTVNGVRAQHALRVDRIELFGFRSQELNIASQPIRAYADPGTQVRIHITGISPVNDAQLIFLAVSGHFVDFIEARAGNR